MGLDVNDLSILEELLNEEILNFLNSGYGLNDECVIDLRTLIRKLGVKEVYNFEKRGRK